jgi:hypothetical protein
MNFSDDELRHIVAKQLPAWKRACTATDTNTIVLHESAFGRSHSELLLLACAIKYAALNNKGIHIVSNETDPTPEAGSPRKVKSIRTYRERQHASTGHHSRRKNTRAH